MDCINENDEIIYNFFEENKKQFEFYKNLFHNNINIEYEIVQMIRQNIQENHIPILNMQFNIYTFLKKDKNCRGLMSSIRYLSKTNTKDFFICLSCLLKEITNSCILTK
jgi:hypothetical protein